MMIWVTWNLEAVDGKNTYSFVINIQRNVRASQKLTFVKPMSINSVCHVEKMYTHV